MKGTRDGKNKTSTVEMGAKIGGPEGREQVEARILFRRKKCVPTGKICSRHSAQSESP